MLNKIVHYLSNDWDTATKNLLAIQRVRELHSPIKSLSGFGPEACKVCSELTTIALGYEHWVAYGLCPTIKALEGTL